ncbi:MAG: DUF554 domain-containing protein, partial [Actinomycetes bacterium]
TGTALNVAAILVGSSLGVGLGHRFREHTRSVVTDALGLVTLLIAALDATAVTDSSWRRAVGASAPVLIVLGSLLVGGILGSVARLEQRLESLGDVLRRHLGRRSSTADQGRFVEGFVTASLVFCVGPLAVLGALSDGLGKGIDQLALKSVLDCFASIAFAASLGWGVAAAALSVLVVQGAITALGFALGGFLPATDVTALTATGGLLLVGVGLRLLRIRQVPVADLLPALVVAPLLSQVVASLR